MVTSAREKMRAISGLAPSSRSGRLDAAEAERPRLAATQQNTLAALIQALRRDDGGRLDNIKSIDGIDIEDEDADPDQARQGG